MKPLLLQTYPKLSLMIKDDVICFTLLTNNVRKIHVANIRKIYYSVNKKKKL